MRFKYEVNEKMKSKIIELIAKIKKKVLRRKISSLILRSAKLNTDSSVFKRIITECHRIGWDEMEILDFFLNRSYIFTD